MPQSRARKLRVPLTKTTGSVFLDAVDHKFHGPAARIWAVRTRKTAANAYMPAEVVVMLDGRPGDNGLLFCIGWCAGIKPEHNLTTEIWPRRRLKHYLGALTNAWHADYGKSWKLEIRPIGGV